MATTTSNFVAFPVGSIVSTQYEFTVGTAATWISPASGTALEIATDLTTWLNDAARPWNPGKNFVLTWARYSGAAYATLEANVAFSMTLLAGDNVLGLPDCILSYDNSATSGALGTWAPRVLEASPLWGQPTPGNGSRVLSGGGAVRAAALPKTGTINALCDSPAVVRLTDCLTRAAGLPATATYAGQDGSETALAYEPPRSNSMGIQLWRVSLNVYREG